MVIGRLVPAVVLVRRTVHFSSIEQYVATALIAQSFLRYYLSSIVSTRAVKASTNSLWDSYSGEQRVSAAASLAKPSPRSCRSISSTACLAVHLSLIFCFRFLLRFCFSFRILLQAALYSCNFRSSLCSACVNYLIRRYVFTNAVCSVVRFID